MSDAPVTVELHPSHFGEARKPIASLGELRVEAFRYPSGVAALGVTNGVGSLILLPFQGQQIWDAEFHGRRLTMLSAFDEPQPTRDYLRTYGAFFIHCGGTSMGNPGPDDDHPLHGELPNLPFQSAQLVFGRDERGPFVEITGECEYVMGFGAHYLARPSVRLHAGETLFDIVMDLENLSSAPMELMYMCHVNFAYAEGARIVQPAPFTPQHVQVRTAVPGHVTPNDDYLSLIRELAADPSAMETLDQPGRYDPEQVFYVRGLPADAHGDTHMMMRLPEGGAFGISYPVAAFPKTVRWILVNGDAQVAAFALPSTCEPEGYLAEKAKNNIRMLASGERAVFPVRLGYLDAAAAGEFETRIHALQTA